MSQIGALAGEWESLERVDGIEPTYAAWKAAVLPLNYTRSGRTGFDTIVLRSSSLSYQWNRSFDLNVRASLVVRYGINLKNDWIHRILDADGLTVPDLRFEFEF